MLANLRCVLFQMSANFLFLIGVGGLSECLQRDLGVDGDYSSIGQMHD